MGTKERIMTIRLMEKLREHPALGTTLGIVAVVRTPDFTGKKET